VGYRLHGAFQKLTLIWAYSSHRWLCIQVGRGHAMS
jgi:hypothetical protein